MDWDQIAESLKRLTRTIVLARSAGPLHTTTSKIRRK
jgi:hypothetical protein